MNREQQAREETALLRSILGVDPDDASATVVSHSDELILGRILAGDVKSPAARPRQYRFPVLARIAVASVVVAAIVLAGIAFQAGRATPASATPPLLSYSVASVDDVIAGSAPSASDSLRMIADASRSIAPVAGHGSQRISSYAWYLTTSVDEDGHATIELAPTFQTTTIGPDGSFENTELRAPALAIDGTVIDPDHYPTGGAISMDSLPAGTSDPSYPTSLPREPEALRLALIAAQGGTELCGASSQAEAACFYNAAVDLFTRYVVPSDLASALWRTLGANDAFVDMGVTTDRLGREGHAVSVPPNPDAADQVQILIIDPLTSQLLSWEQVSVSTPELDATGPTVTGFQAIVSSTWVDVDTAP